METYVQSGEYEKMNGVKTYRSIVPLLLGLALLCAPAWGADQSIDPVQKAKDDAKRMFPVDQMIRQAAENVSRRYNLNNEQKQLTVDMFEKRVWEFLDEHEDEIWPLVRDLGRYQLNPNRDMDPSTARQIGKAIRPIFEDAQKSILEANEEWRGILNEDQKRLHDYDLKEMDKTFQKMDENFNALEQGKTKKASIFPQQPDHTPKELKNPKKPAIGSSTTNDVISENPDFWETYVRTFCKDYALDKAQVEAANSILRDIQQQARDYQSKHENDYKTLKFLTRAARKSHNSQKEKELAERRSELNKPIAKIFEEMVSRLNKLPRPAQIREYKKTHQKVNQAEAVPAIRKTQDSDQSSETEKAKNDAPATPTPQPKAEAKPDTNKPQGTGKPVTP